MGRSTSQERDPNQKYDSNTARGPMPVRAYR
jgi:hypothetical protein